MRVCLLGVDPKTSRQPESRPDSRELHPTHHAGRHGLSRCTHTFWANGGPNAFLLSLKPFDTGPPSAAT